MDWYRQMAASSRKTREIFKTSIGREQEPFHGTARKTCPALRGIFLGPMSRLCQDVECKEDEIHFYSVNAQNKKETCSIQPTNCIYTSRYSYTGKKTVFSQTDSHALIEAIMDYRNQNKITKRLSLLERKVSSLRLQVVLNAGRYQL